MKRTNSQEPTADSSHSCPSVLVGSDWQVSSGSNGRATSAAMLGIALSMGASGVLLAEGEASAAVDLSSVQVPSKALQGTSGTSAASLKASFGAQADALSESKVNAVYHTVEDGESLWQIAQRHKVAVKDIKIANRIPSESPLQVGQVLKVPADDMASRRDRTEQPASVQSSTLLALAREESVGSTTVASSSKPSKLSSMLEDVASVELASELPGPAPAPIVPSATVEHDQTLRSAGIVTQADGFQQELDRVEVAELALESRDEQLSVEAEQNVPVVATLSPANPQQDYRVQAGDTLGSIARSLGVTQDQLAHANGLDNPDFILAGENLVIPEPAWGGNNQSSVSVPVVIAPAPAPTTSEVISVDKGDSQLARLQSTVQTPVNASTVMNRLRGQQADFTSATSGPAADPYTASLISQVESVREQTEADGIAEAQPAIGGPTQDAAALALVNPEFQNRLSEDATNLAAPEAEAEPAVSRPDSQLMAAAPLSPDAYAPPAASPATGQVVSPDMPVLPDSEEYLPDAPNYFNGYIWPTRGTVTSGYGWRWGRMHRGVDVAGPVGTPIVASAPGVVERSGWNSGGYGNLVEIRHADGSMTRYAHNSRLMVRPGQQVDQGQQIAEMGSTGYSTGPHLHFEVHIPNQGTVNPVAYLPGR
ncbi:MAG: peptidoglycan DD-metalloendopeptidase family protein [Cyanobacteria bacterium J06635_1]